MIPKFDKNLASVCILMFCIALGVGATIPVFPLYARKFEVQYIATGLVVSAYGLARLLMDIPAGSFADRFGRKPLMLLGGGLYPISGILAIFASNIYFLLFSRFFHGLGAAFFTNSATAYSSDIAPLEKRGRYISFCQGSFFAGLSIGPTIGGFLADLGGYQAPFILLLILPVISMLFNHFFLTESLSTNIEFQVSRIGMVKALKKMPDNTNYIIANFAAIVLFIAHSGIRLTLVPLYGEECLGLSSIEIGLLLSIAGIFSVIILLFSGIIIDKFRRRNLAVFGFIVAAISCYGFTYAMDIQLMSVFSAMLGLSMGILNPTITTLTIDTAHPSSRGLYIGINRAFCDFGILAGPILTGLLSDAYGLSLPFTVIAIICFTTSFTAILLREKSKT